MLSIQGHSVVITLLLAGYASAQTQLVTTTRYRDSQNFGWPQWGGLHGNFIVKDSPPLSDAWPAQGPREVWRKKIGDGYSAILVDQQTLYTAWHTKGKEVVVALNAATGATLWDSECEVQPFNDMTREFGPGPNATPLLLNDRLYFVGIAGLLRCLEKTTGKTLWNCPLHEVFGKIKRKEEYGYSCSPLAYKNSVIVMVGGEEAGVVAFRPEDGKLLWKTEPLCISYAPPVILRLRGRDQLLFFTIDKVVALDPATGATLWDHPCICKTENHLTSAIQCGEEHVWIAGQLDAGTRLLNVMYTNDQFHTKVVWKDMKLVQAHWNSIVIDNVLYGCKGGNYNSFLSAIEWRTGKTLWTTRGHHLAKPILVDRKYYWITEQGNLVMAELNPTRLNVLGSHQLLKPKVWTPPSYTAGILYVRNRTEMVAVDLR